MTLPCPVCRAPRVAHFLTVDGRDYLACPACACRFLHPAHRLDAVAERAHYDHHNNDVEDQGYRRFLAKLAAPLLALLPAARRGLDFGCGPGPALAAMLTEAGHDVSLYDPFYAPDSTVLGRCYDFITATEVIEHLFEPADVFDQLDALLVPSGVLALMTCFQTDDDAFAGWHYRRDPTHVVFYRAETLNYVARQRGWSCDIPAKDVALLTKPAPNPRGHGGR